MSGMNVELFEKIQQAIPVGDRIKEIDGRRYTYGEFNELPPPMLQSMKFATLVGFVDFANSMEKSENYMVTVDNETSVTLRSSKPDDKWRKFDRLATADAGPYTSNYSFSTKYDPEDFMIGLQTGFVQNDKRDLLIKVAGNLSSDSESKTEDDGISQSTTVGRAVKTKVRIENPIWLMPFRTFQEIPQIESPFVFRIHSEGRGYDGPQLALYESDSGKWKLDAIEGIKKYLLANLNGIKVFA